ncbi:hypothetical protein [Algoriphagus machipongonensis]|nr:hypothetical protein [Algoriphagus machipongonensis]
MNGKEMMEFLKGKNEGLVKLMPQKIKSIHENLGVNECYVETSHLFIKGFGWMIPEYIPQEEIGVIVLKREKQKVIESLYRIHTTPLSYHGRMWVMFPSMKNAINKINNLNLIKYRFLYLLNRLIRTGYNPFRKLRIEKKLFPKYEKELTEWYINETYAQGELFIKKFPKIKVYNTNVENLNKVEEFEKMFDFFNLNFRPKPSFFEVINKKTNLKR